MMENVVEKALTTCKTSGSVMNITMHNESWMGFRGKGDKENMGEGITGNYRIWDECKIWF